MILTAVLSATVFAAMIVCILFFPSLRVKKLKLDTYYWVTTIGAVVVLFSSGVSVKRVSEALVADSAVNPVKILILFLSMTILSVFLDELGFFRRLAYIALKKAGTKQFRLFLILYLLVSALTIFTSNDIIVLSFTPFICYFAKSAKIDPVPYLAAEFVAANTWSMALIIGNPTNIYLASAMGIDFAEYLKYSIIPTICGGVTAFAALFLTFRKKLKQPVICEPEPVEKGDKLLLIIGVAHLAIATILLAISSYIAVEMWLVALCSVASLFVFASIAAIVKRQAPTALGGCAKRTPYQLIPFMLSMFVIILTLNYTGFTVKLGESLGSKLPVLTYGLSSFLTANIINNIPMSVLFSSVINGSAAGTAAVFATIIGSNICALLTPIGALAGIMWSKVIGRHGVKFTYLNFLKIGLLVAVPTLIASLCGLQLALILF